MLYHCPSLMPPSWGILDVGALVSHERPAVSCLPAPTSLSQAHHFSQGLASNFGSGFNSGGIPVHFSHMS
jgi:hypothetical protein